MYCIAKLRLAKDTRPIQTKTGTRMQTGFVFGDLALALESDCVTIDESEYIEQLIGAHAEMQVS